MEDNSSDDEMRENNVSPRMGGKKLKLNDGSSQESIKETASSSKGEKEENVDSGVSADKSESTSSEDRGAGSSGAPSNELVSVAPSSSNMRAILLNIKRPKRNYRKRRTPDRDSSSDSSRDSDDLSGEEAASGSRQTENSDDDSVHEDILGHRLIGDLTSESNDSEVYLGDSSDESNSYESDELVASSGRPDDADSEDDGLWPRADDEEETSDASKGNAPSVLKKTRPKHNYLLLREIINREMGLTFPCGKVPKNNVMFEQKFYGSLHVVHRMKKLHHLNKHKGCVNSVNFHPEGNLLASGSDDMNVIVWDWARNLRIQTIKTGHKSNVFQSKFLHLNARSQLNIVTCARDGQVRLLQCPPSGGAAVTRRRLASHAGAAHKLHVSAAEPHSVLSAGEDGRVLHSDVRAPAANKLVQVKDRSRTVQLYSIHGHPLDAQQFVVAGRDRFVRVFDRRKCTKPTALYCPDMFRDNVNASRKQLQVSMMHLTCAVYNHDGSEILGSYNDEDIYLFDAKADVYDKDTPKEGYTHCYSGHRNSATVKGVSFFGPKSEYVVSGSDCSFIYMWEKRSEAIVQWMQGDNGGVVNCIETHPRAPVLATSGLDKDVKIWIPISGEDPDYSGLEAAVRENSVSILRSPLFNDFLPSLYTAWRSDDRGGDELPRYVAQEFHQNVCTAF